MGMVKAGVAASHKTWMDGTREEGKRLAGSALPRLRVTSGASCGRL